MKDFFQVLRQKVLDIERVRKEIEALHCHTYTFGVSSIRRPRYPAQTSKHSNRSPIRTSPSRGGAGGPAIDPLGAAS